MMCAFLVVSLVLSLVPSLVPHLVPHLVPTLVPLLCQARTQPLWTVGQSQGMPRRVHGHVGFGG